MNSDLAAAANAVVSLCYFTIGYIIASALVRKQQVRSNRLGAATAMIFFTCAMGHGLHALDAALTGGQMGMGISWYEVLADLLTAGVALYYLSLRRMYSALLQGPTLFEDLERQRRLVALEEREALSAARAAAERERDAQAGLLHAVIANSQSLIYVKDLEGRYLMVNAPFERTFGVRESDLLGLTDEVLDPLLAPLWRANDQRAQVEQFEIEEWTDGPDGRSFYESVKFPLRDADGVVYATCGISLEVTARRRAAMEMARARDAALAATAAKSAFLATMSHEIRTPMNAVIGLTGLLLDTDLDAHQRDLMETVRASGDVLLVVINDILDFSKIEAGELHMERQVFSVRACAENALDMVAPAAAAKGLDLVLEIDEQCPAQVVGDTARVGQVLVNLLNNAVKFTDAGDVLLTVAAAAPVGEQVTLTFTVRDTGIGIPADRMDRLFESFSQVDASTSRLYGGTGLGLAISRGLVRAMGGDLTVTSEYGAGSSFAFSVGFGTTRDAEPGDPLTAAGMAGRSVLVVDDNETNRRVLSLQLAAWGMLPTCAATPHEALDLVTDGACFEAAILDMQMPVMDGDELAAALRVLPGGRELPMVMLRSVGPVPAPRSGTAYAAVLTKPVKLAALQAALQSALSGAGPVTAASGATAAADPQQRPRVLLAEDNLVNQKVARLMLAQLGCDVDVVDNGAAAVAAATASSYSVVLMDVHMPRMDGLEATRIIRAELPAERQPRIVALTANALLQDRKACSQAGMDDYLVKPVRQEQLAAMLSRIMHTRPEHVATFDPAVVDALVRDLGGDGGLRRELLSSYVEEGDQRIVELTTAARDGNRSSVRSAAHALRSSSQILGLTRLAELLHDLEVSAGYHGPGADGQPEPADLSSAAGRTDAEYRSAARAIVAFLAHEGETVSR